MQCVKRTVHDSVGDRGMNESVSDSEMEWNLPVNKVINYAHVRNTKEVVNTATIDINTSNILVQLI